MASRIVAELQKIPHNIYAEPFCGGAAVLFKKPLPIVSNRDSYREALNDTNDLVTNLYRVARSDGAALEQMLALTPYSRTEHGRAVEICKGASASDLERAWALVVNISMSFAKSVNGSWGYAVKGANLGAIWANKRSAFSESIARLNSVHIDNSDALSFIERWDAPDALFYCDPPYVGTRCEHYSGYTINDFSNLCRKLDSIQGSYVLSCYDQGDVMPESCQRRVDIASYCSVAKNRTNCDNARTEVLWICDRSTQKNQAAMLPLLSLLAG